VIVELIIRYIYELLDVRVISKLFVWYIWRSYVLVYHWL